MRVFVGVIPREEGGLGNGLALFVCVDSPPSQPVYPKGIGGERVIHRAILLDKVIHRLGYPQLKTF